EPFGLRAIESGRWFVQKQDRRRVGQGPGELDHPRQPDRQRRRPLAPHRPEPTALDDVRSGMTSRGLASTPSGPAHDVAEEPTATAPPLLRSEDVVLDAQPPEG